MGTAERLEKARAVLATATARRDAEQARLDNRHWTELDSATGSGIRRKPNAKADARRFAGYARSADIFTAFEAAEREVDRLTRQLEYERAEATRQRFTREDIAGAFAVRTSAGWHKVARVNAKTVSVETGYSWTDRIEFDKILDYRKAA